MSIETMSSVNAKAAIVPACFVSRSPGSFLSLRMILGCVALPALQACAYAPPYPAHVLDDADPWINSIRYLSDAELQQTCAFAERVLGCGNLTTGEIFVLDDPALSDCVLQHERSHFREVFVERVAYEESAAHAHWYDHYCAD
ncbi:MAG: hypothetical protein ACO1PZ_15555 [Gammaproteobacteria bacterium]